MRFDNHAARTASDLAARAYVIDKTDRISHALDLMEKHKVNQLLVTNEGEIFGVLTKKGLHAHWRQVATLLSPLHHFT